MYYLEKPVDSLSTGGLDGSYCFQHHDFANEVHSLSGRKGLIEYQPEGQTGDWQSVAHGPNPARAWAACGHHYSKLAP